MTSPERSLKKLNVIHWERVKARNDPEHLLSSSLCNFSATLVSGEILIFGGLKSSARTSDMYSLNYSSRKWKKVRTMGVSPEGRSLHSATLAEDALIIISGNSKTQSLSDLWAFDLATSTWEKKRYFGDCPGTSYGHTAEFLPGIRQVVLMQKGLFKNVPCALFLINPQNYECKRVVTRGRYPYSRSHHMSCAIRDTLFVFGGYSYGYLNDLWFISFDKPRPSWENVHLTGERLPGVYGSTFAHYDGKIIVFGGQGEITYLKDTNVIDLRKRICTKVAEKVNQNSQNLIISTGNHPSPSNGHAYVVHENKMYLFGGIGILPHYYTLEMNFD